MGTSWGNNGDAYLSYDFVRNYVWEASAMVDKINYSPKRVIEFDIDELYRQNLDAKISSGNKSLTIMGDYGFQNSDTDTRKGVSVYTITSKLLVSEL